ncbi:E3 ubiquitin-protein ligase TRIM39 [Kryptolebias marmoratus]|uniref:E3 ubiquitin-protein ligase TRIM39-like n=1 Tax=Kryptolebias marmoratus TaxID=37003 RepID=A0A3Q2ZNU1_KRYMA|nr:E3 ubiquitin-protein ligase TRIM39 [Kryptolebias marmoratus]
MVIVGVGFVLSDRRPQVRTVNERIRSSPLQTECSRIYFERITDNVNIMSVANYQLPEDHLWCCICLDVFKDPVTLPCGHNFCKSCIEEHLRRSQRQCPLCKELVDKKHKLGVNTFISELVFQFRQSSGSPQPAGTSGTAPCCPAAGPKQKSSKCRLLVALSLTCFIVFFGTNLCFHRTLSGWETLPPFASVEDSSGSVCAEHQEPLELYCKDDQVAVCQSCRTSAHRNHQVVPLGDQVQLKMAEVGKMEARIQQVIGQRRLKIRELKRSMKLNKESADQEMADGVQIFSSLIQDLEHAQAELIEAIEEKQRAAEKRIQSVVSELEQEVSQLRRRRVQLEQLSHATDPVLFLQSCPDLTTERTQVSVCPVIYDGLTRTAMVGAMNQLTETVRDAMKRLQDSERKNVPQFAVSVTLDPDTAHPALVLSDDGKQVRCGDAPRRSPTFSSRRFQTALYVFGRRGFSCGRFHFDVQVKGKTAWTLGVAKESVNKKEELSVNPENGYWAVRLQDPREYVALDNRPVSLPVGTDLETVRVSVDYEEGRVSFYDVDAAVLLHSFAACSFTEELYPFLSPGPSDGGRNAAPLIVSSVSERREN